MSNAASEPWLVACLCAQWCRTCGDYEAIFAAFAAERPELRCVWIDIEDESDALGDFALDVQNLPSLLVARGSTLRFYGTLLPHASTLRRTVDAARQTALTTAADGLDAALIARLHGLGRVIGA